MHWTQIDDELALRGIGRKDTPFNGTVRMRMMSAYSYLDDLLSQQMPPFSPESIGQLKLKALRISQLGVGGPNFQSIGNHF